MSNTKHMSELYEEGIKGKAKGRYWLFGDIYFDVVKKVVWDRLSKRRSIPVDDVPAAVIVKQNDEHMFILNGDSGHASLQHDRIGFEDHPTISFRCLSRFVNYGKDDSSKAANGLASGRIQVLDWTTDKTVKGTKSNRPGPEFTWIEDIYNSNKGEWHRAATVLVRYRNRTIILGQDEGSYFGSELPNDTNVSTINDAYIALMPEEVRDKKNVQRQGEWFIYPVSASLVPNYAGCLAWGESDGDSSAFNLPKDWEDSSDHTAYCEEWRVSHTGVFVKNVELVHSNGEHVDIVTEDDKWYKVVRNTAVRSYSEEGVD